MTSARDFRRETNDYIERKLPAETFQDRAEEISDKIAGQAGEDRHKATARREKAAD